MQKDLAEEYSKQGYDPKIIKMEGSKFEFVSIEAYDCFRKAVRAETISGYCSV